MKHRFYRQRVSACFFDQFKLGVHNERTPRAPYIKATSPYHLIAWALPFIESNRRPTEPPAWDILADLFDDYPEAVQAAMLKTMEDALLG